MLEQMSSPTTAHAGEAAVVRVLEGCQFADASSDASSDTPEEQDLPQCRIRRNYNCAKCPFFTQNPRVYLAHVRDTHNEKIKIYECPQCVYASRHHQKLLRHVKMLHSTNGVAPASKVDAVPQEVFENAEDMLEEVSQESQDSRDVEMEFAPEGEDSSLTPLAFDESVSDEVLTKKCEMCKKYFKNNLELVKHLHSAHKIPGEYFSCEKCSYVTHIRTRFRKHVKYHSMPMIKCTLCDFHTPYKWNLDRHMKNHGGTGSFVCCMCNFTADIKQSMTVHEMNHHMSLVGENAGAASTRRRNKVGGSDMHPDDEVLILRDEEVSEDSQSDVVGGSPNKAFDITSSNKESSDVNMEPYHIEHENDSAIDMSDARQSFKNVCSALDSLKQRPKLPRPIPQLIPLNSSTPTVQTPAKTSPSEPPLKKFKDMFSGNVDLDILNYSSTDIFKVDKLPDDGSISRTNSPLLNGSNPPRKKNETFFDKLKERLLTETGADGTLQCKNCGFESKCLSEHSVHEKNCVTHAKSAIPNTPLTSSGSTRCQNCRHRCKSSADLYIHMQTCKVLTTSEGKQAVNLQADSIEMPSTSQQDESDQPHPMENVVFVWNTMSQSQTQSKLDSQLDIIVNDDSQLDELNGKSYDPNNVDALHDTEASSLSPTQAAGKKVFKCPHCPFWASTASRFHVHIVGHLNKKPFECSLCNYRSNWRWDITKHIKLKSVRDPEHNNAKVLMTDETGRRNYSKYNKFLASLSPDQQASKTSPQSVYKKQMQDLAVTVDEHDLMSANSDDHSGPMLTLMPLNLQKVHANVDENTNGAKKPKKTLWKCKRCNYRNPSKDALLDHVREHSKQPAAKNEYNGGIASQPKKPEQSPKEKESETLAYQCGHCNQLSNWKHVIQRHCRLKHNGVIKVITTEKPKTDVNQLTITDINTDFCTKCPFRTTDKQLLLNHMYQHTPSPQSVFKCYFCPYFVTNETDLMEHLQLHGITDPASYISKVMGGKSPMSEPTAMTKRHKCSECPYETNSKSQFMYHEQFHKPTNNTPYKCKICNYSVTKRHLLHQHMKVHGVIVNNKPERFVPIANTDEDCQAIAPRPSQQEHPDLNTDQVPYVWVSAKNEFHKMFKCRYCSYVNSQQCKIPNHEKIHCIWYDNEVTIYKCLECKYTCDTASKLTAHSTMHGEIYGRIYCAVDPNISDEEQIAKLRLLLEEEKQVLMVAFHNKEQSNETEPDGNNSEERILYFCTRCPTRFFVENELKIHSRFHDLNFAIQCKICTFTVPQESQMASHTHVHTEDYQSKTKMLQLMHKTHTDHQQPRIVSMKCPTTDELIWIVPENIKTPSMKYAPTKKSEPSTSKSGTKHYSCELCPAKFFKSSALNYHTSLHGGEGTHRCKKCDYTVKNIGNLAKHELVHEKENLIERSSITNNYKADYDSGDDMSVPLSGTDLFQRKTEAEKRVHKNDKLLMRPNDHFPPVLQADPQFGYLMHGNPEFVYPTYLKNGRQKEKRYKCHKCPSAFEKREQYKVHLSLHGSKQRYKCELCDYSVKYYANYVQHMRKHQMNAEAKAERNLGSDFEYPKQPLSETEENGDNIKLAIKTIPKYTAKSDFQQFSIGDQQTLRLLQRRRSSVHSCNDTVTSEATPEKDKKIFACIYCPYSNQRRDALENHMRRHKSVSGMDGNHECVHCDFSAHQSHFVREHLKIHFNTQKNAQPECFVQNEGVVITITQLDDENNSSKILLSDIDMGKKESCAADEDKIFVQPITGEIVV